MNELHLIKIRRESRYEGVPGTPQLLLELGDSQLSIEDISASAARVRRQNRSFSTESHCRLLLDCELPLEIGGERIGKTDGPTLSLLESGGNSRSVDLVMKLRVGPSVFPIRSPPISSGS